MQQFDKFFKHIVGERPREMAMLALGTRKVKIGGRVATEHLTIRTHFSDMAFDVHLPKEDAILHIEAQTDDSTHKPMHRRMLAYSSALALEHEKNVYSTVIYFRPPAGRNDPGFYQYGNEQRGGVSFRYNVILMYELEGKDHLDPEAIGILPFTALMKPPEDMTAEAWVDKCIETTLAAKVDSKLRSTLLFGLSLYGSLAHPKELFKNPLTEAIMQESPFYQDIVERSRTEGEARGINIGEARGINIGEARGARQTRIESALDILADRFPSADVNALKRQLEAIDDLNRLKQLPINASKAKSLHDFQQSLNGDRG